jgi:hypothetical protein
MPPGYWSRYFWILLHGAAIRMDQMTRDGQTFTMEEVAQFLRGFSGLLPCTECQHHFSLLLAEDFRHLTRWPDAGYFAWTVSARARIAERLGRPVRDEAYCRVEFNIDFYGNMWNALQLMSFAYPLEAPPELRRDTDLFFRFLPRVLLGADPVAWAAIIDERERMSQDVAIATSIVASSSSSEPGVVQQPPVAPPSPFWTKTRERFILGVYALRSRVQTNPAMTVPALDVIVLQWARELNEYVLAWKRENDERVEARRQQQMQTTVPSLIALPPLAPQPAVPPSSAPTSSILRAQPRLLSRSENRAEKSGSDAKIKYRQRSQRTDPADLDAIPPLQSRYQQRNRNQTNSDSACPRLIANSRMLSSSNRLPANESSIATSPPPPQIRIPRESSRPIPVTAAIDAPGSWTDARVIPSSSTHRSHRSRGGQTRNPQVNGAVVVSAIIVIIFAIACGILFVWLMRPTTAAIDMPIDGASDILMTRAEPEEVLVSAQPVVTESTSNSYNNNSPVLTTTTITAAPKEEQNTSWWNWFTRPQPSVEPVDVDAHNWGFGPPVGWDSPF